MLMGVLLLAGCKAVPQIAAIATGGAAGAATGSPAVGFAVGVATDAAANAAVKYYGRSRQHAEQDAIATAAADVPPGGRADWHINHLVPIGDEHGELHVVRWIENPLATCKQIVFSVDTGKGEKLKHAWFTADLCRKTDKWDWATAEPAVPRWGYLQ
jgi:hypothetical protein